jgi:LemA protein
MGNMTIEQLLAFDWLQLRVSTVLGLSVGLAGFVIIVATLWRQNNGITALANRCNTASADVDALLKNRHDLIPGLVETVRGFTGHEHDVLIAVAEANAAALRAVTQQARVDSETMLGNSINSLLQSSMKYPELEASGHFKELQRQLIDIQNRITAARRFFNLATEEYNNRIGSFPGNLVALLQKRAARVPYNVDPQREAIDATPAFHF